jgi:hypothetical protein
MEDLAALARRMVDRRRMLRFVCGSAQTVSLIKALLHGRLLLVALLLDDERLGGAFETIADGNKGAPCNKGCDLRPRPVRILFEGIAGQISEARRI